MTWAWVAAALGFGAGPTSAQILQTFYIPMPEAQMALPLQTLVNSNSFASMLTVISISASANGTLIYYDHWEDGYESNLLNPTQSTTQVWGDGNPANGMPPGHTNDVINAGTVIHPENTVPLPRNPAHIFYDGGDKIGATKPLAISRAGWNPSIGPVLAGAVEVSPRVDFGNAFRSPVGQNMSDNQIFEHVSLLVMASTNNTTIRIDRDANGTLEITNVLHEGQGYIVHGGVNAGAYVTSSAPIQAHLITGDVGARWESRWFSLAPRAQWSSSYYNPVGTTVANDPAHVYVYNPNGSSISVRYDTQSGSGSFNVPAGGNYKYQMPMNSGAHFYTTNGSAFYALGTVDTDAGQNMDHDWGFSLVPETYLTPMALIGWGPGAYNDSTVNGSPVWVTATKATTLYVDFDGDPTTGAHVDPLGQRYDQSNNLARLQSLRVFDTTDNDQTGMRVYTVDGTLITAAWGQDPATAAPGNPFLDLGTTVPPLPVFSADKDGVLVTDLNSNGRVDPGDTLRYTLTIRNDGIVAFATITVKDTPSENVTYVPNSTTHNGSPVSDDASGTPFPLDGDGLNIGGLQPRQSAILQYRMVVNSFPPIFNTITNTATIILDTEQQLVVEEKTTINTPSFTACALDFTDAAWSPVAGYAENGTLYLRLIDGDRNQNVKAVETVSVLVLNNATGDRETLTLTESGTNTGVFRVSLPGSSTTGQSVDDGVLYALAGQSVWAQYADPLFPSDVCTDTAIITLPTLNKPLYLSETGQGLDRIDPRAEGDSTTSQSVELSVVGGGLSGAISLDRVSTGSAAAASSLNVSHATGSGANRLMLVGVSLSDTNTSRQVNTITYAGQSLSLVGARRSPGNQQRVELWQLLAPPSVTSNVVVSLNGTCQGFTVGVITFNGVHQGEPLGTYVSNLGSNANPSVTATSAAGELVLGHVVFKDGLTLNGGSGQTQRWSRVDSGNRQRGAAAIRPGADTVTMSWSQPTNGVKPWAIGAVSIKPIVFAQGMAIWSGSGDTSPDYSVWDGASFGASADMPVLLSDLETLVSAACPARDEKLAGYVEDGGRLYAQIWNGSAWSTVSPSPLATVASSASHWPIAVAYEQLSGDGMVVYSNGDNDSTPLTFMVWNGSSWSSPQQISAPQAGVVRQIRIASKPGADEMVLVASNADGEDYALVWNGSSWGNGITLTTTYYTSTPDFVDVNVAYEQQRGRALVVYAKSLVPLYYRTWNGSSWSSESSVAAPSGVTRNPRVAVLAPDPNSNRIGLGVVNRVSGTDRGIWLNMWSGSSWGSSLLASTQYLSSAEVKVGLAFESGSGEALAVYLEDGLNTVTYRTWRSTTGWSAKTAGPNVGNTQYSVALYPSPVSDSIMMGVQDSGNDISYARWNGSSWGSPVQLEGTAPANANQQQPFTFSWDYPGIGGEVSTVFEQGQPMATDFTLPAGGRLTVTTYVSVVSGAMPANPDITAEVRYGETAIAILSNPTYSGGAGILVWSGILSEDFTVPAGERVVLEIRSAQANVSFKIQYDSSTKPSQVSLPTLTVIDLESLAVYDAPYDGGESINQAQNGQTVYIRATATDPFGPYDITGLDLVIDDACGGRISQSLTDGHVVATTAIGKTYEWAWATPSCQGMYTLTAIAHEGSEGITNNASILFPVTFQDYGTDGNLEFVNAAQQSVSAYDPAETVYVRLTDTDQNSNTAVVETVTVVLTSSSGDSETRTLTETGPDTGIFTGSIASAVGSITVGNGILDAPLGNTITVAYVDPDDSGDAPQDTALINTPVPGLTVRKTVYMGHDGGASAPGSDEVAAVAGTPITYCFEVENSGQGYLKNVALSDTNISPALNQNLGTLAPGQAVTVVTERTVSGNLTNTARATATPSAWNGQSTGQPDVWSTDTAVVLVAPQVLAISKQAQPPFIWYPGLPVTYTITVANTGAVTQAGVTLTDPIPTGLTYQNGSAFSITALGIQTNSVRDEFATASYDDNYGSVEWATDWVEVGETNGPSAGSARISGGEARLRSGMGLRRSVNLDGALSAELRFNYREEGDLESTDRVLVEISTNGTTWAILLDRTDDFGGPHTTNFNILAYAFTNTFVRFRTVDYTGTSPDETFVFDNVEVVWTRDGGDLATPNDDPPILLADYTLAPGETLQFSFTGVVGSVSAITNRAVVTSDVDPVGRWAAVTNVVDPTALSNRIGGQVRFDVDGDGDLTDPDEGIADVTVRLFTDPNGDGNPADGTVRVTRVTNPGGFYLFSNLSTGRYVVVETDPPGYVSTADAKGSNDNRIAIVLTAGMTTNGNDFLDTTISGLSVSKTADPPIALDPSSLVTYTIQVTNNRPFVQTGIAVVDNLPAGLSYVENSARAMYELPPSNHVSDLFSVTAYTNNHGTISWAGAWQESGDDNNPAAGNLRVTGGELQVKGNGLSVWRSVNLFGYTNAVWSFQARAAGVMESSDILYFEASSNGSTWVVLAARTNNFGGPISTNFNIKNYISSNTSVRFRSADTIGADEFFYLDNVQINAQRAAQSINEAAAPPPNLISDFSLHPGKVVTITFTAQVDFVEEVINQVLVTSAMDPTGLTAQVMNEVESLSLTQGVPRVEGAPMAAKLAWTASIDPHTGEVQKDYDLISVDRLVGFDPSTTNDWLLVATVTNTFGLDAGTLNSVAPGYLGNDMRFYRAARRGQWSKQKSPRVASREVYVLKNIKLQEGENWISLFMIPDSNTVATVLGTNGLPAGSQIANSTRIEWYGATTDGRATNEIWLSNSGHWMRNEGGPANHMPLPLHEGFNMVLPPGSGPRNLLVIGRVPESTSPAFGHTHTLRGSGTYNVVSYNLPYRVKLKDSGLRQAGFKGAPAGQAVNPNNSDELRVLQRGGGSLASPRARILMNNAGQFVYWTGGSGSAEEFPLEVDDALIVYSRVSTSNLTWSTALPYPAPNRNINP